MIYVVTQNDEIIFTSHLRETFDNYIDGLCVKYKIDEKRFDSKINYLNAYGFDYYVISLTFNKEE